MLSTDLQLVSSLRMSGPKPVLPLYAFMARIVKSLPLHIYEG